MFHRRQGIVLPPYSTLERFEGKGNYAIKKYYKWPWRFFYRKKLSMIASNLHRRKKFYRNVLDFGAGPGIFIRELERHAHKVISLDRDEPVNLNWRFEAVVCSSVLEFCFLPHTLELLKGLMKNNGVIVIASPMNTWVTRLYFRLMGDKSSRHSHEYIFSEVQKRFHIFKYETWLGMYFCIKAYKYE